jgi:glucose uptake protein
MLRGQEMTFSICKLENKTIMNMITGFFFGLLGMIFFALYGLPKKFVRASQREFMVSVGLGAALCTTIIGCLFLPDLGNISFREIFMAYVCGFIWYAATLLWVISVDLIGFSRATPIKNLNCIFSVIYGIFFFHEYSWRKTWPLLAVFLGGLLIIIAVLLFSRLDLQDDPEPKSVVGSKFSLGFCLALLAGLGHASYVLPWRICLDKSSWGIVFFLFTGQGIFLAAIIAYFGVDAGRKWYHFRRIPLKEQAFGILSGILFALAFACTIISINTVGMAIGMLLVNMNTIVAVPASAFILKEIDLKKGWKTIIFGICLSFSGTLFLFLSKL